MTASTELQAPATLHRKREEVAMAIMNRDGFDIASLDDTEFERRLERMERRDARLHIILSRKLKKGLHYGNPNKAFKKDILLRQGATELCRFFQLHPALTEDPTVTIANDFVSVTLGVAVLDNMGRVAGFASANCNTSEVRFNAKGGGKTFVDAREAVHQCTTMAFKRGFVSATLSATGADAFFADQDEYTKAIMAGEDETEGGADQVPLTDETRKALFGQIARAGVTKEQVGGWLDSVLGRAVKTNPLVIGDVAPIQAALTQFRKIEKAAGKAEDVAAEKPFSESPFDPEPAEAFDGDLPE